MRSVRRQEKAMDKFTRKKFQRVVRACVYKNIIPDLDKIYQCVCAKGDPLAGRETLMRETNLKYGILARVAA